MAVTTGRITGYHHVCSWDLTARAEEIGFWRGKAADAAVAMGASDDAVFVVRQGVSELIGNVVDHVEDPRCCLSVSRFGFAIDVQLRDRSSRLPVVGRPDWERESGRGLWMLREMADAFGCELIPGGLGKWVRFRLTCSLA